MVSPICSISIELHSEDVKIIRKQNFSSMGMTLLNSVKKVNTIKYGGLSYSLLYQFLCWYSSTFVSLFSLIGETGNYPDHKEDAYKNLI